MLRIAHVSDLHVLAPAGVELRRILFNKRVTGYANLVMRRARVYRRDYLLAVLAAAAEQADHLVVTGDITNLSLEGEYEEAFRLLENAGRSTEVTVVPSPAQRLDLDQPLAAPDVSLNGNWTVGQDPSQTGDREEHDASPRLHGNTARHDGCPGRAGRRVRRGRHDR